MIKLYVQDYCHDCPNFEAETSNNILYSANGEIFHHSISVTCEHRKICESIYKNIEKRLKESEQK